MTKQLIFNKKTHRYNTLKTAIKNGFLNTPQNFIIPNGFVYNKNLKKLIKEKTQSKRLVNKLDNNKDVISSKKIFNERTKRFINKDSKPTLANKIYNFSKNQNKNKLSIKLPEKMSENVISKILDTIIKNFNIQDDTEERKSIISVGDQYYSLNEMTITRLKKFIMNKFISSQEEHESDADLVMNILNSDLIELRKIKLKQTVYAKQEAGFFKYLHNMNLNLEKYGIFKTFDERNYNINCVVRAFENSELFNDEDIDYLKSFIKNRIVPLANMKLIAEKLNCHIVVNKFKNQLQTLNFNKKADKKIKLGMIDNHYFLIDTVEITHYALTNYKKLQNIENFHTIKKARIENGKLYYKREKGGFINSFRVIKYLFENKEDYLSKIKYDDIIKTQYYDTKKTDIVNLNYNQSCCKLVRDPADKKKELLKEKLKNKMIKRKFYVDLETNTKNPNHIVYQGVVEHNNKYYTFNQKNNIDVCEKILDVIISKFELHKNMINIVFIHNLGYDIRFFYKYLDSINIIDRGTSVMNVNCCYKGIKILFKDTKSMIPMPLKKFKSSFGLVCKKEILPYGLYNNKNLKKDKMSIKEATKYVKEEDKKEFLDNINKWGLVDKKDKKIFDHWEYSAIYCREDVKVMRDGYEKFREWMQEITKLDIIDFISLPSVAHQYLINEGCYNGVYKLSGTIQNFIMKTVKGGRCMTRENKPHHLEEGDANLADYDANSLYPSAMSNMNGFLLGKPKVLQTLDYNKIKQYDGFFIEIRVNKVNKHLKFPILNHMTEDGTRLYTNEINDKNYFVSKSELEDLIEFQQIEFDIIRGYYYDESFNNKINESINYLYNERLKKKQEGNKIEKVYKLLLNSSYGKTIMKPIEIVKKFKNSERFDTYYSRNYNYIDSYTKINDNLFIIKKRTPINDHYNICSVGSEILSQSKRIMHRVMCLCEDNDINIYYQDTDSMHIEHEKIPQLEKLFYEKYNKQISGDMLGQFSSDFDFPADKGTECYATESIFISKKIYIDKVRFIKEGIENFDYHIRMKGVGSEAVEYVAKNNEKYNDAMDIYKDILKGGCVSFDLTKVKPIFNFNKNQTISSRREFVRKIKM